MDLEKDFSLQKKQTWLKKLRKFKMFRQKFLLAGLSQKLFLA